MAKDFDIYQMITDRMIELMEQGEIPWTKPWLMVDGGALKYRTGKPYSLLNQFLLSEPGEYMSLKECNEAGGKVRKGAKSRIVVFWKQLSFAKKDEYGNVALNDKGEAEIEMIPYLRYCRVFHIRDCEGVKPKWSKEDEVVLYDTKQEEIAEEVLKDYLKRELVGFQNVKQNRAYYSPSLDSITVPLIEQFSDSAEYYSTVFHEVTHSTGHPKRQARFAMDSKAAAFGSKDYSKEELVAEIGAAAIIHKLGMESKETFRNSTAYVQGWLDALKNDKKLIVSAAGKAEKAVRLILNQPVEVPAEVY